MRECGGSVWAVQGVSGLGCGLCVVVEEVTILVGGLEYIE